MTEEKKGIEQIKKTLEFAFDLSVQVMEILKDKKVTAGEGISLALKVPKAWGLAKGLPELKAEIADIDPDELQEILVFLLEEYEQEFGDKE